jgi:hypothetical protein
MQLNSVFRWIQELFNCHGRHLGDAATGTKHLITD